jgi:hypothetical protein
VVLDQPLVPRVLYGNYEAPRFVFAARFWPLLPLLFAANPDLLPRDSDKVTGTAIIREINIARQNPTLYASFFEQTRQNYAGRVRLMPGRLPVCTQEVSMQWMRRYDSCATHDHFQRLRSRRACVQPRLIIAVRAGWRCRRTSRVRWERCRKPN